MLLNINKTCANLLSNNRLTEEGEDLVDSRGHPIAQQQVVDAIQTTENTEENQDYENLILVGVWLAVKENGETLQNFLKWTDLPVEKDD